MLGMYDPETEEVYEYTWTVDDLLKSVYYEDGNPEGINETLASMKYDYEGKRTEKTGTKYVYANGKAVVASSYYHNAAYIYAGDETIGAYHGNTWYDYFNDQQGSTMGILKQDGTTAAAYTYSDFGETEARYGDTFQNEVCYTGSVYDWETGEYYLNARYYDPALANFLSQDTYKGSDEYYAQWNLYEYCAGDPINKMDLNGHKYMPKKAAKYALDWGKSRNPEYYDFKPDLDCTNFVSQCVEYGGKEQTVDPNYILYPRLIKPTTEYWYSVKGESGGPNNPVPFWKVSSSWAAVNDFYTYWKNEGAIIKTYKNKKKLSKNLKVGDIVQLHKKGDWTHSIIISCKKKGTWRYAGHCKDHKYNPISKIKGYDKYRIIRIK